MKAIVGKEIDSRVDSEHCSKAVKYMILHIDFDTEIQKNVSMKMTKKQESIVTALAYMQELFGHYPQTELQYETPFQLLVAVMLSAQTTDKQVNKVTEKLFSIVKTPHDLVDL